MSKRKCRVYFISACKICIKNVLHLVIYHQDIQLQKSHARSKMYRLRKSESGFLIENFVRCILVAMMGHKFELRVFTLGFKVLLTIKIQIIERKIVL